MIYTVTLNPSIDYVVHLSHFADGLTNRSTSEEYYLGGKGINVSCVLAELGIISTALGFTAGFTGKEIERLLIAAGIRAEFIRLAQGVSRINVKIKAEVESEINGGGPPVTESEFSALLDKMNDVRDGDTVVLAGSIPPSVSDDAYERMLARLADKDIRTVVDATGSLLLRVLPYRPFLIKPNRQELSEIFSVSVESDEDIAYYAGQLMDMGARNVLVSLGGDGAVLFAGNGEVFRSGVLRETVLNTVGAGDSMVAGFLAGLERTNDMTYALKLGTACGNATAFSAGLATKEKIAQVLCQLP